MLLVTDCPCVADLLPPLAREKSNVGVVALLTVLQTSFVKAEAPVPLKAFTR